MFNYGNDEPTLNGICRVSVIPTIRVWSIYKTRRFIIYIYKEYGRHSTLFYIRTLNKMKPAHILKYSFWMNRLSFIRTLSLYCPVVCVKPYLLAAPVIPGKVL